MDKFSIIKRLESLYKEKVNIIEYLKKTDGVQVNSVEDIMISYDLQAGSYVKYQHQNKEYADKYTSAIANVINSLDCSKNSIFECGVGEATTLAPLLKKLEGNFSFVGGNDISWSRIAVGKKFATDIGISADLVVGDIFDLPLADNSIDIVYTSHSLEPNGGHEEELLIELYRVAKKYIVLLEPAYEFANEAARLRMEKNGYVTRLYDTAKALGYNIVSHRLFEVSGNPLNPTGLMVIKKDATSQRHAGYCCPVTKTPLTLVGNAYYSTEALLAYPIINGVPVLLKDSAVVATKMTDLIVE